MNKSLSYICAILSIITVALSGCEKHDATGIIDIPEGTALGPTEVTSVCSVSDSVPELILGTTKNAFYIFNPITGTSSRQVLPTDSANVKIYGVVPVGNGGYLVQRRNRGLEYVHYDNEGIDNHPDVHINYTMPAHELPHKGTHFSTYKILPMADVYVLATSNGLLYLPESEMLNGADTVTARFVRPLEKLRDKTAQFAQENIFAFGDTVVAVTDNGIYAVAYKDFDNETEPVKIADGRFWSAAVSADSLFALKTAAANPGREILSFKVPLRPGATPKVRDVANSVQALAVTPADSLIIFGDGKSVAADNGCVNARVIRGQEMFYINNGHLMHLDVGDSHQMNPNGEFVKWQSGDYAVSNRDGLWRLHADGDEAEFIGGISGLGSILGIHSDAERNRVLLVSGGSIMTVDAGKFLLPSDRKTQTLISNGPNSPDKLVCALIQGDTLLVGSRTYLKAYALGGEEEGRELKTYKFGDLDERYESCYVTDIQKLQDGTIGVSTLNSGNWTLKDITDEHLAATPDLTLPSVKPTEPAPLPARPTLTWESVRARSIEIAIALLAIFGLVVLGWLAVRSVHRRKLQKALAEKVGVYRRLIEKINTIEDKYGNTQVWKPFTAVLQPALKAAEEYCADPESTAKRNQAQDALLAMNRQLKEQVMDNARVLTQNFHAEVRDGNPLAGIMADFKRQIELELNDPGQSKGVTGTLTRAVAVYRDYLAFRQRVLAELRRLQGKHGLEESEFAIGHYERLWNAVKTLDVENVINPAKYTLFNDRDDEPVNIGRVAFTALVFHNTTRPLIAGQCQQLKDRSRQMYNFSPKPYNNHGTVYKIVARAMAAGYALADAKPLVPERIADILWDAYFSHMTMQIRGLQHNPDVRKSLYDAILVSVRAETDGHTS